MYLFFVFIVNLFIQRNVDIFTKLRKGRKLYKQNNTSPQFFELKKKSTVWRDTFSCIEHSQIFIGDPTLFIGDHTLFIGEPNFFIGEPRSLIRIPQICNGGPQIFMSEILRFLYRRSSDF